MPPPSTNAAEIFQLKAKAAEYYQKNGVPLTMENVLNEMFYDDPEDVFGYLSNYYERLSQLPKLESVSLEKTFDSSGGIGYSVRINCTYKNNIKNYATAIFACDTLNDQEFTEAKNLLSREMQIVFESNLSGGLTQQRFIDEIIRNVVDSIGEKQLLQQQEGEQSSHETPGIPIESNAKGEEKKSTDAKKTPVKSPKGKKGKEVVIIPNEPPEELLPGSTLLPALSLAFLQVGANIMKQKLDEYVRYSFQENSARSEAYSLHGNRKYPALMVPLIASGKAYPGKQNCVREYLLVVSPSNKESPDQILKEIFMINKQITENISKKIGMAGTLRNANGCLCPAMDRPEQGIDFIKDALHALGLMEGYNVVLSLASYEIFDLEKGKYEVITGTQKSADDLVEFYHDLVHRNPLVIGLIDPMRKEETDAFMNLSVKLSERCFIISENSTPRPGILLPTNPSHISGWIAHLEGRNTILEIAECVAKMKDADNITILSMNNKDTNENWLVDLAFGLEFDFLRCNSITQGENITKLSKWCQLASQFVIVTEHESHRLETPNLQDSPSNLGIEKKWHFRKIEIKPNEEPEIVAQ